MAGLFYARHSAAALRSELEKLFGDATLGDLAHPVVIPAVDASAGAAVMFKTPHHPDFKIDHARRLVDVALATSAAPTYFPVFRSPDARLFVDGGLVANAPGLCGLHEAEVFFDRRPEEVRIVAVGTASVGRNIRSGTHAGALDLGTLRWGSRVFDLTTSAQESLVHNLLRHRCQAHYVVIDSRIDTERARDVEKLDGASPAAIATLLAAGSRAGQEFVGSSMFSIVSGHRPAPARFYYGARASTQGAVT
jgi:hypothetical protein